jgi:hypothetical protein
MSEQPLDPPVETAAPPPPPAPTSTPDSIQARIRAARAAKQAQTTVEIRIPGYRAAGVELFGVFRALSWEQSKQIGSTALNSVSDESDRELYEAADTLAAACVKTVAVIDGERHDLPPLGVELARYFDDTADPQNPRQAVFLIFDDETRVVLTYSTYAQWRADVDLSVDRGIAQGN